MTERIESSGIVACCGKQWVAVVARLGQNGEKEDFPLDPCGECGMIPQRYGYAVQIDRNNVV